MWLGLTEAHFIIKKLQSSRKHTTCPVCLLTNAKCDPGWQRFALSCTAPYRFLSQESETSAAATMTAFYCGLPLSLSATTLLWEQQKAAPRALQERLTRSLFLQVFPLKQRFVSWQHYLRIQKNSKSHIRISHCITPCWKSKAVWTRIDSIDTLYVATTKIHDDASRARFVYRKGESPLW